LGIEQNAFTKTFEVVIQLGSILAVLVLYFERLLRDFELWKRIIVAFIPTGVLGLVFYKIIKGYLFNPLVVSVMLILGGFIFIAVEFWLRNRKPLYENEDELPIFKAFLIGLFQSLAMIPGTSRSGSTIIGGLILGMSRRAAAEFSFLLAIPTMFAATGYDLLKHHAEFTVEGWHLLAVGFVTAFFTALVVVKWFLNFISRHSFIPFGVYRIVVGGLFLALYLAGVIKHL
jgi:undecaprenyl-diphosphatase